MKNGFARLGAVVVLVSMGLLGARAQDGSGERYTMKVRSLVVDSCDVICPCLFGDQPTHGHCRNLAAVRIDAGKIGSVSLDGASFAMLGEFTGETRKGATWGYHAFYLDRNASPEQKEALRKILGAPPFSKLGTLLGTTEVALEVRPGEGPLDAWTVKLGDKGSFTATPVVGGDGKRPQALENPVYPFPTDRVVFASAKGELHDHGKDLVLDANSGEISSWTLEGEVPPGSSPLGASSGE